MTEILWVIVALSASALWGLIYVLDKRVLDSFSVLELLTIYYGFSALASVGLLMCTTRGRGLVEKLSIPENFKWMAWTTVLVFIANLLIVLSIHLSNATLVALVEISYPLFTVLFSCWLLKTNTLTWDVAIGGALILSGVLWISLRVSV